MLIIRRLNVWVIAGMLPSLPGVVPQSTVLYCTTKCLDDVGRAFHTLLAHEDDWNGLVSDTNAIRELNDLIYYYATEIYGRLDIKSWLRAHKDKSVLDRLTPNDLAYTVLVYDNYHFKWKHEMEVERAESMRRMAAATAAASAGDDHAIFMPPQKKQKKPPYDGPSLPYTKPAKSKKQYLEIGWNTEGIKYLKRLTGSFTALRENHRVWTLCKEFWEDYVRKMSRNCGCWVPQYQLQDIVDDEVQDAIAGADGEEYFEFVPMEDNFDWMPIPGINE